MQVLQKPNNHPKFHGQEIYAATIQHPLASIQVQLEGYLGLWCDMLLVATASTQMCSMPLLGILSKVQLLLSIPLANQSNHWMARRPRGLYSFNIAC